MGGMLTPILILAMVALLLTIWRVHLAVARLKRETLALKQAAQVLLTVWSTLGDHMERTSEELRTLRLASRTRIRTAENVVHEGGESHGPGGVDELVRLGRASAATRRVVGGEPESAQRTKLERTI